MSELDMITDGLGALGEAGSTVLALVLGGVFIIWSVICAYWAITQSVVVGGGLFVVGLVVVVIVGLLISNGNIDAVLGEF